MAPSGWSKIARKAPFAISTIGDTVDPTDPTWSIRPPIPPASLAKHGGFTGADSGSTTPGAEFFDPFVNLAEDDHLFGQFMPQVEMLTRHKIYKDSLTAAGNNVTKIDSRLAMRNGYKIVRRERKTDPVDEELSTYIMDLTHEYGCYECFRHGIQLSETWGWCVAFLRQVAERGYKKRWNLCVKPIFDENIVYEQANPSVIKEIVLNLYLGRELRRVTIPAGEFVMWRAEEDPFGNGFHGQVQFVPAHNIINEMEDIRRSWAGIMKTRGLGMLAMIVEGAEEEDLQKWRQKYNNPSQFSIIWGNERLKPTVFDTVSDGMNITNTLDTYGKELSRATGWPTQRMEGNAGGKTQGAETVENTQAEAYSVLQEKYEPWMIKTLTMIAKVVDKRDLETEDWELDWDIEIKMDRQKRSNIFTTEATAVNQVDTLLTVNDARERIGKSPLPGAEGKMWLVEWKLKFKQAEAEMNAEIQQKRAEAQAALNPNPQGGVVNEGNLNKEGKPKGAPQDPANYQKRDLAKEIVANRVTKAKDADGRQRWSLAECNDILDCIFDEGMKRQRLVDKRKNGDKDDGSSG